MTLRAGIAAALALGLAACFYSEEPLIERREADRVYMSGHYTHAPYDPETGAQWDTPTWVGRILYRGRRYDSPQENFPHRRARLHRLGGDVFIAEVPTPEGDRWMYGVVFRYPRQRAATYHIADCHALNEAARAGHGVTLDEEGFCRIENFEQLQAVMRAYLEEHAGEDLRIDGIYRRER
ncbi:MAG: hypothetical protein KIS81_03735 [Maricaulaceae bacterium]|nr:hypothetical protein [Maricaulaceae bacterium]